MSGPVNIMILCNNEMAIPAMQQVYMSGSLKAVVVPEKNTSLFSLLKQMLAGTGVHLVLVNKKTLEPVCRKTAAEKNITAAWIMTFSYIIPKSLLSLVPGGFINFHYGILPQYRGVNPVLAQMLAGETASGITVHVVDENIDTGPIVMQQKIAIDDRDTFGIQLQKLGMLGASMVLPLLRFYQLSPVLPSVPQDESQARYFKKPVAADLMINWNTMGSQQVIRLINACNPWNKGAGAMIGHMGLCLTYAEIVEETPAAGALPGTIITLDREAGLKIYCFDNKPVRVDVINTPEGFFGGSRLLDYGIKPGDRFLSPNC
jgi:methionyl-tRNA formyltransferase